MEQEEYKKEEIKWNQIEFSDNRKVLELIEKVTSSTTFYLRALSE